MRKILLFFLIALVLPNISLAQRHSKKQHEVVLNGNNIELPANFQEMKASIKAMYPGKAPAKLGWFIIQFNSIPTIGEQNRLKSQGVELLDYLQGNAYFAYVSSDFLSVNTKETKKVHSLITIKPEYKINQELAAGNIPEYAKGSGDFVKVVITYFKNADVSSVTKGTSDIKMINKKVYERFHSIEAEISQSDLLKLASFDWVKNIQMASPPYELDNDHGKSLHRSNVLNSNIPGLGYNLTGKGVKIGLWDADVYNHRDFNDRVTVKEFESHNTDHGTHTCGTIAGAGLIDPKAEGMAPEVAVYSWNFNTQSNGLPVWQEMLRSLDNDGIEITSNSYGFSLPSCPNPYAYNSTDYYEDAIANMYPYYLFVFSAGNDQGKCPESEGFYSTTKNLKNSLMVAAIDEMEDMSSFSSFGPSKDGRLIPNISGDGVDVYSTEFDNGYGYMSGTSMATPGVAGTMALIYQRYKETHGGEQPISSLMRALACNTARDLGNPGPDYKYGYGAINGLRAVEVMEQNTYITDTISQGRTYTKDITIPGGASALRVMLAWTDAPNTGATPRILINDLDLTIDDGTTETNAWVLDPNNPSAPAVQDYDGLNNMEQVTIDKPAAGTYTISVDGYEIPDGVQEFAVVYDIVMPELKLTYPIGGESLTPEDQVVVRWDCEGYDNPFTLEYSTDGGVNYAVVASNIDSDSRAYLWTVPTDLVTNNAKFRISNGSVLNEDKISFNVMPVPQNVNVASAQCEGVGTYALTWDAVTNAKYEVLKLNGQVYEHLAEVTSNSYDITDITNNKNNWYCVRAIDLTNGAVSQRSLAVTVNPAVAVVSLPFSEDFESEKASNFYFTSVYGQGNVRYVNDAEKYGIRLEGTSGSTGDWVNATGEDCFTSNPMYIVSANICTIDASSMAGKDFGLKFDYRQKYLTGPGTSYFRVIVNEDTLTNSEGTKIYGATNQLSYKSVYYDLSDYAGLSSVKVKFEAVCKTNYITFINNNGDYDYSNDNYDKGDFVTIDNVEMLEPLEADMALTDLTAGTGQTATETITVQVQNLSGASVSNIPVSYTIDGGTAVNEVIAGPIAAMEVVNYDFTQTADFSVGGIYHVEASVNLPGDQVTENDTLKTEKLSNGADILIGSSFETTTCDAVLTDPSGRYLNYANSQEEYQVIAPGTLGKNIKISFTEFALEEGWDFLYIYNGMSLSDEDLLGEFTGYTLPPSITSTADDGKLTILFFSDGNTNDEGFVATLECVDKPNIDVAITAITEPLSGANLGNETVTVTAKNFGIQDLTDVDVYYQIGENTPVSEVIPTLDSLEELNYSFTTPADLSTLGSYAIKAWIKYAGDTDETNDTVTVNITNSASAVDAGISEISDVIPARTANSEINVTVENFGNEAISNFDIAYTINGGAEVTQTIAGPIAAGATEDVSFTTLADLSAFGTSYTIKAYTKLAGDEDADNDTTTTEVLTPTLETTNVVGSFVKGGNNAVFAGANAAIDLTNNYTIECWVNLSDPASYGHIFNKTNVSLWYETNYGSAFYGTNTFILSVTKASGSLTWIVPDAVKPNTWQHIALTVSSANVYTLYIDGVAQTWTVYSGTAGAAKTNANYPICIGNRPTDLARSANGYIDEVRVWNSALTQGTIQANMMTDYPANTVGMVAYYKFKEGNGNYVYDYSSNDNTANIYNADVDGMGDGKFWNTPGFLLKDLNFTDEKIPTTFNADNNTFTAIMDGADLSSLVANFTVELNSTIKVGTDVQTSGSTVNDFSASVAYTAEGTGFNTGITQNYTVNVTNDLSSDCDLTAYTFETADNAGLVSQIVLDQNGNNYYKRVAVGMDVSALKASFTASSGAKVYVNNVEQTSPQAATTDYSNPVMVKVVAENGRDFKIYNIFLDTRNNAADLTAFGIVGEQVGTTDLNSTNHTIGIWVKNSTDLSMLSSTYTVSSNAKVFVNNITQLNGITANDFTNPVAYKVVSEDESASVDWTVTVTKDETVPVITLTGNAEETIAQGSTYVDEGATATDNIDGDITSSIEVTNPVNTNVVGEYTVRYNVTDAAGNDAVEVTRTVNVIPDQIAPEITLLGDAIVNVYLGVTYTDAGATALDNADGDITSSIIVTNPVNTAVIGQYTVKYNVTDAAGNDAVEVTRTVNVIPDQTAPEITLLGDAIVNVYLGVTYTDAGATALDNVDGDITSSIVVTNTVNTAVIGQYTVKYNVSDAAGNDAVEVTRTVNVQAKEVASITVTGANNATTITVNAGTLQMSADVLPSDATDNTVTWSVVNGTGAATINATGLLQASSNGTVTVIATANDGSGISGSLVVTISNQGTYIDDVENNIFSIYPNPADNKITISTNEKWNKLIIYNSIGVIVKTTSYTEVVDVSDLPSGSYIISIANEKESFVKHFIKK